MRIAVLTTSYPRYPGDSAAPFIQAMCQGLADLGHAVAVLAPYDPEVHPQPPVTGDHAVSVQRFRYAPLKNWHIMGHARALENDMRLRPLAVVLLPFFLLASFLELWRLTGRHKSELIHAHWVLPNGLPAAWVARLRKLPLVITLHGSDVFLADKNPLFRRVARSIFRRATLVTAVSPELRERAQKLGALGEIPILPMGVSPEVFYPAHPPAEAPGIPLRQPGELRLVALGRMVEKKGFHVLLAALPEVFARFPQARLVLGGDGPALPALKAQAQALGLAEKVIFAGRLDWPATPGFLAGGDLFVLPSVRDRQGNVDGTPTVLMEAMSCGLPVVASEIGGASLVIQDRRNGRLVPSGDPQALARAINELLADPAQRLAFGQAGRKTVLEQFAWSITVQRLQAALENRLGNPVIIET